MRAEYGKAWRAFSKLWCKFFYVNAERTHAWLAQAELPADFEYSAKRAAKLKERCDSYSPKMSNPFETKDKVACESPKQPAASAKKPNVFKRFIACISIEPW